jgi:uncharacterized membrane protein
VLEFGWRAVTGDYVNVGLPLVTAFFVIWLIEGGFALARAVLTQMAREFGGTLIGPFTWVDVGWFPVSYLIGLALQAFILGGAARFSLDVARGQKPEFGVVFSGGNYFLPMFAAHLIASICVGLGLMLCVVPGIILSVGWMLATPLIVDRNRSATVALRESWQLTSGQRLDLFGYLLLMVGVAILGFFACCLGLVLLSLPVIAVSSASLYIRLTGEPIRTV